MMALDLYDTRVPTDNVQNGKPSYVARLLWCAMYYMDQRKFCAHDLALLVEEIYGEQMSSFKASHGLRTFAQLGYVDRIYRRNRSVMYYDYRVSQKGFRFMRRDQA